MSKFLMIHSKLTQIYKRNLKYYPKVVEYLYSRGLIQDTIEHFQLGYCSNNIGCRNLYQQFTNDELIDSGLFKLDYKISDRFNGRITIPIIVDGQPIYMTSRLFKAEGITHLHQHGPIQAAVNFDILKTNSQVIIVEGPFDCMTLHQKKFPSIGLLGANRISPEIIKALKGKRVYIAFDNDPNEAGQQASKRLAEKLSKYQIFARIITLPAAEEKVDVNSYFQTHNRGDFLALVKESTTMSFKFKKTTNGKLNKEVYPIIVIAEKYGLPIVQVGNYYKCPCPFHEEKNPSLTFYPHTGSFYCFGCGAAGDALELIKKLEALQGNNYNYIEIVEMAKNL